LSESDPEKGGLVLRYVEPELFFGPDDKPENLRFFHMRQTASWLALDWFVGQKRKERENEQQPIRKTEKSNIESTRV
jgi:hypothetical protein